MSFTRLPPNNDILHNSSLIPRTGNWCWDDVCITLSPVETGEITTVVKVWNCLIPTKMPLVPLVYYCVHLPPLHRL